jgi:uncharacterized protein
MMPTPERNESSGPPSPRASADDVRARAPAALISVVRRHPLAVFFGLAFVLSWWPALFYAAGWLPSPIVGFGPFLAAVVVLAATEGRRGVVALLKAMVQWRARIRWYAVALLGPIVFIGTAVVVSVALGAQAPASEALRQWPQIGTTFLLLLLVPGIGGAWEEPGWRGYALPRMIADRSPLVASLVIGTIVIGWHLPLFLIGQISWWDVPGTVAMSVVLAAVYLGSGGSVLLVMIMHAMNNAVSGHFARSLFTGEDVGTFSALANGTWCLAAVVAGILLATTSRRHARHPA